MRADITELKEYERFGQTGKEIKTSPTLQSRFSTLPLPSFDPLKDVLRGSRFVDDDELEHSVHKEFRRFSKEFYATGTQRLTQR